MRKFIPVVVAGATALAVAGGAFGYTTLDKDVTLSVEGASTEVSTMSGTVGEVLTDRGISVGDHDVVAPALDAKLTDGTRIAVQYGRQVTVKVDGKEQSFWTTATTVGDALSAAGIDSSGADLSTSRSASVGRQGLSVDVATAKTVTINDAGTKRQVTTTAQTVAGALAAAKIKVDADDELSVKPGTTLTDGAAFSYTRVDVKTVTTKQDVDYQTTSKNSSNLTRGTTRLDTAGRDGVRTITYRQTLHNGKVKTTTKTKSEITTQPRSRVFLVGTKALPVPTPPAESEPAQSKPAESKPAESKPAESKPAESKPAESRSSGSGSSQSSPSDSSRSSDSSSSRSPSSSRSSDSGSSDSSGSSSSSPSVASGSVWDRLAECEAGGSWSINTGNGFYGGLQFTLSTWRGYGGSGMPHQASREAQIAIATKVQAGQGWGAWPACTSKLGIR